MNATLQISHARVAESISDNVVEEKKIEEKSDFEMLVEEYCDSLYHFALCLSQNESKAFDLTKQTFQLCAEKSRYFRDSSKARVWLFTALYHRFLGPRRHEICFPVHEMNGNGVESQDITSEIVSRMDSDTIARSIMEVEEHYRVPLVLYFENHSHQEIAKILKMRVGAAMLLLARGKQQLHKILSRVNHEAQEKNHCFAIEIWREKV